MYYLVKSWQGNGETGYDSSGDYNEDTFQTKEEIIQFLTDFEVRKKIAEYQKNRWDADCKIVEILEVNRNGLEKVLKPNMIEAEEKVNNLRINIEKQRKEAELKKEQDIVAKEKTQLALLKIKYES